MAQIQYKRMRISITPQDVDYPSKTIDTGLGMYYRVGLVPSLGVEMAAPGPAPGTLPASRVQVIPQAPTHEWEYLTHSEPFFDPATGTVKVRFTIVGGGINSVHDANVLFWDLNTAFGPVVADTYAP